MLRVNIPFTVQVGDETLEGAIRLRDAVAIERKFKTSVSSVTGVWPLDWMLYGAWVALKRAQKVNGNDYDAWLDEVEGFDLAEDPEAPKDETPSEVGASSPTDSAPAPDA